MDIHLSGILLAYAVVVVGLASPGPSVLAIISTALERGREPAVFFASGIVCGSAFWGITAALRMAAVLVKFASVLYFIKIAGGVYLLWLAWRSLRAVLNEIRNEQPKAKSGSRFEVWLSGLLLHLTNPKAILGWIATIALGVTPTSPTWVSFVVVVGGICLSIMGNFGYALLFSTGRMKRFYQNIRKPIGYFISALFGVAGVKLLTSQT
ncbi:MAG: LysE family translocator [Pseudomonadota bacterium]